MIRKATVFILSFGLFGVINAQTVNLNQPIAEDASIVKGTLENGMTYYLHSTDVTKNVASYYIIQNVGSVLENDDQQGLAHFLEHMAFNGTENFKGKGILDTFQKHGLVFGRDINAYTGFDETVYNIDNIPTTPELIDTGLQVLHDWSNYLMLTEEEIDAERGVIKEEWRTRQNGQMRILQQTIGTMFNNSKYSSRLPIGLMDIVEKFEYKALRDFYHDWYRTDLQAIAIVGDFDIDEMEQKIKNKFSSIPSVDNPLERYNVTIADNEGMTYQIAKDKEVSTSRLSFNIRHKKSLENETVATLKKSLLNSMVTNMLSNRLSEIAQTPEASFLGAGISYSKLSRTSNSFGVSISPKPNQQEKAFKDVITEVNRVLKFGFTKAEINRTKVMFENFYTNQIERIEDRSHKSIIETIKSNYLENVTMADIVKEFELVKAIFKNLKDPEIHERLKQLYTKNNRVLIVTGVDGRENLSEEKAVSIISEVEQSSNLTAYTDDFEGKSLMAGVTIEKGSIVATDFNKNIEATTFSLSNGIKVHYKFSDKNKNSVRLNAISKGGSSLISDKNLPSNSLLGNLVNMSGIGEYSAVDLKKVLTGKTAGAKVSIGGLSENIHGSSVTKDVETMLQLVHLRFVKPRFDAKSFEVLQGGIKNYLIRKSKDLNSKVQDSITVILYGKNNPKKRIFDEQYVNEVSFDQIKEVYLERFKNANDFEFFIVGDVSAEVLKPLLEKFIASIPTTNLKENWKDNTVNWVNNAIDKDVFLEMEDPKSSVFINVKNKMDYSLRNYYLSRALGDILQLRYTETLREQEGGTYGARVSTSLSKRPFGKAVLGVNFDCDPGKVEQLIAIVYQEIDKIKQGYILQEDVDKTLTNYLKKREESKNYSSYEMSLLRNYYREGYNMNDSKNFEDIINSIKIADIQEYIQKLLLNSSSYEIVIKPKK